MVAPALQALCQRKLGIDLASLSEAELQLILPDILEALYSKCLEISEVQKSAVSVIRTIACFNQICLPSIVREESLAPADNSIPPDPNEILESVLPLPLS